MLAPKVFSTMLIDLKMFSHVRSHTHTHYQYQRLLLFAAAVQQQQNHNIYLRISFVINKSCHQNRLITCRYTFFSSPFNIDRHVTWPWKQNVQVQFLVHSEMRIPSISFSFCLYLYLSCAKATKTHFQNEFQWSSATFLLSSLFSFSLFAAC